MHVSEGFWFGDSYAVLTWIPCTEEELVNYQPVTQAYGIVFENQGQLLIINENEEWGWKPAGGTPEGDETLVEALIRELREEADVRVKDIRLLGVQKVEQEGKVFYQARFTCRVDELLPQTIDPAKGVVLPRKLVPAEEINEWVKWGATGRAMFESAIDQVRGFDGKNI